MWQPEMVLCSRTTFGKVGQNLAITNLAAISCPVGPNIGCQIWSQTESGCRIWSLGQILGRTIFAMAGLATPVVLKVVQPKLIIRSITN